MPMRLSFLQEIILYVRLQSKLRPRATQVRGKGGRLNTRLVKNPKTRAYENELKGQMEKVWSGKPATGALILSVVFMEAADDDSLWGMVKGPAKPDISNLMKAVEDAGNGVIWKDDVQIVGYKLAMKVYGPYDGIRLKVYAIDGKVKIS